MKHLNQHSTRLNKGYIRNESNIDGVAGTVPDISDESTEVSSEEQTDILDFFVKDRECVAAETSVINLSDDEDNSANVSQIESHTFTNQFKNPKDMAPNNVVKGQITGNYNFTARKRGRPPKQVTSARNMTTSIDSKNVSSSSTLYDSNTCGRTKPSYKNNLQNSQIIPTRSLNCAIKFGEPVGIPKKVAKKLKLIDDPNMAVLNRPRRTASQKLGTSCSTDEENVNMTWREMRDLEKALTASLKNKGNSSSSLDQNIANSLAQRKFVEGENVPKKRGRKKKEPSNILVGEKAYTEDFINFLCSRSATVQNPLPNSKDLFMNCVAGKIRSIQCSMNNSESAEFSGREDKL